MTTAEIIREWARRHNATIESIGSVAIDYFTTDGKHNHILVDDILDEMLGIPDIPEEPFGV